MLRQIINDKVILLNSGALTVSFLNVEMVLKLLLLSVSIIYTVIRIYREICKRNDEK